MTVCDLYDLVWLITLLHHVQLSSAVSLIIPDADGNLRGLQPLKAVTLTAAPLIDILQERIRKKMDIKFIVLTDLLRFQSWLLVVITREV